MKFEVLTAVILWAVMPCSLVEVYRRFKETCCFHRQDGRVAVGSCETSVYSATLQTVTSQEIKQTLGLQVKHSQQVFTPESCIICFSHHVPCWARPCYWQLKGAVRVAEFTHIRRLHVERQECFRVGLVLTEVIRGTSNIRKPSKMIIKW